MRARGVIVGAGRAGTHLHYGAMKAAGAEIVGFVEPNPDLLEAAKQRFGMALGFTSLEEAFRSAGKLDFVDICSDTNSHFPLTRLALEHGCHVVVEKPITTSLEELEELRILRAKKGRMVCAVHNHKFFPGMQNLRQRVGNGELGQLLMVRREMSFMHDRVRMMEPDHWAHKIPGGRLFEANPHNLYLLYGLLGELDLVELHPRKTSARWPHVAIDEFLAILENERAQATIHMTYNIDSSETARHGPNYLIAMGSKKSLYADYHRVVEMDGFKTIYTDKRSPTDRIRELFRKKRYKTLSGEEINVGRRSGHYWLLDQFIRYIEGRTSEEPVPFEEAYFVQKMNLQMGVLVEGGTNVRKSSPAGFNK